MIAEAKHGMDSVFALSHHHISCSLSFSSRHIYSSLPAFSPFPLISIILTQFNYFILFLHYSLPVSQFLFISVHSPISYLFIFLISLRFYTDQDNGVAQRQNTYHGKINLQTGYHLPLSLPHSRHLVTSFFSLLFYILSHATMYSLITYVFRFPSILRHHIHLFSPYVSPPRLSN